MSVLLEKPLMIADFQQVRSQTEDLCVPLEIWVPAEYTGDFVNSYRCGVGEAHYRNGTSYRGEWKEGVRFGDGVYTAPDGAEHTFHVPRERLQELRYTAAKLLKDMKDLEMRLATAAGAAPPG